MKKQLTELQRAQLMRALLELSNGRGGWFRARHHGERVTLASLHAKGFLDRRAWRGTTGHPDAANEYRANQGARNSGSWR